MRSSVVHRVCKSVGAFGLRNDRALLLDAALVFGDDAEFCMLHDMRPILRVVFLESAVACASAGASYMHAHIVRSCLSAFSTFGYWGLPSALNNIQYLTREIWYRARFLI